MILPVFARLKSAAGRVRWSIVWDTYDVFVRDVVAEDAVFEAPDGYRFEWGTADDVLAFDAHHTELDVTARARGAERIGLGHRVVVGRSDDGVAVFTMWVNPRNLNVPGYVKRRLGDHQVFIYKAYTSPDHRGRKLYQAGMRFVLADLAERGMTQLVGYAAVTKTVSRAGLSRLAFRSAGTFKGYGYRRPWFVATSSALVASFPDAVARTGLDLA